MSESSDINALNGHPLRVARCRHNLTLQGLSEIVQISVTTLWRAENGYMLNAESRRRLCTYFGMSAQELGLLERKKKKGQWTNTVTSEQTSSSLAVTLNTVPARGAPTVIFKQGQLPDVLNEQEVPGEQQLGAWLAIETSNIGSLFDAGWSLDAILESLRVILQSVQGMPQDMRKKLVQLGSAAMIHGVGVSAETTLSTEEHIQLAFNLSKSAIAAWKLFQHMDTFQVLSISQAYLALVQCYHSLLSAQERSLFYSSAYNLKGVALHFHSQHQEALACHMNAYIAALSAGNIPEIVHSLTAQANCHHTLGQYNHAITSIMEALRLLNHSTDTGETATRMKAHLLACWADNTMMMQDYKLTQEKLEASQQYLDKLAPSEDFDKAAWLVISGKYTLFVQDNRDALNAFEEALCYLPAHWLLRRTITTLGVAKAYARLGEHEKSVSTAEELLPTLRRLNAPIINYWFLEYLQHDLLKLFPKNRKVQVFIRMSSINPATKTFLHVNDRPTATDKAAI